MSKNDNPISVGLIIKDSAIDEMHLCILLALGAYETEIGSITSFFIKEKNQQGAFTSVA